MWFGIHLVRSGRISADQLVQAVERQLEGQMQLGALAVSRQVMTLADVEKILMEQAKSQKPFGQVAVDSGYLSEQSLAELLMIQAEQEEPIDEILVDMGYMTDRQAKLALQEFRSRMRTTFDGAHSDEALAAAAYDV